jgi:iron complex transport system substrate-binding protein
LIFTDDKGNALTFEAHPERIVSISPSMTETLFALGEGARLVGRDDFSLFPEEALAVESVGALWGEVPTEAILALEPDLVLAAQIITNEQIAALGELGVPVYWQENPASFEELYENLRDIAALVDAADAAEALIADIAARVAAVANAVAGTEETPSVFYELDGTDPSNPWTVGSGPFIDYVIRLAGGTNAAAAVQGEYEQVSIEELINVDPDYILLADAPYGITPESVAERAGWEGISAVINGDVYPFNPDILSQPGPRLVEGLETVARIIHPGLFE